MRAILIGASIASAPELEKNTLSAKVASTSRCASRSPSGMRKRLEACQSLPACSVSACDEMRMGVAERVDGDAGAEIEIALAVVA